MMVSSMPLDFYHDRPSIRAAPRFRPQFGMRTLWVLITLAAMAVWWSQQTTPGQVNERQLKSLQSGMSREQVLRALGPLKDPSHRPMYLWVYRVKDRLADDNRVHIIFDESGKLQYYHYWRW